MKTYRYIKAFFALSALTIFGMLLPTSTFAAPAASPLWQTGTGGMISNITSGPGIGMAEDAEFVYTVKNVSSIEKIRKSDGATVWSQPINQTGTSTYFVASTLKVDDTKIYAINTRDLYAFDKSTGTYLGKFTTCDYTSCTYPNPTSIKSLEIGSDAIYLIGSKVKQPQMYRNPISYSATVMKVNKSDLSFAWQKTYLKESSTIPASTAYDATSGKLYVSTIAGTKTPAGAYGFLLRYYSSYLYTIDGTTGLADTGVTIPFMNYTAGLHVGSDGLYIIGSITNSGSYYSPLGNGIQKRSLNDTSVVQWTTTVTSSGTFAPRDISLDDDGHVYVVGTISTPTSSYYPTVTGVAYAFDATTGSMTSSADLPVIPNAASLYSGNNGTSALIILSAPYIITSFSTGF